MLKVSSVKAASVLVRDGIHLFNRHILIRHYDDILADEYSEYLEFLDIKRRLQMSRDAMLKVARGEEQ